MKRIAKRWLCLILALATLMSCCVMNVGAAQTSGSSVVTGVASDQWKQALSRNIFSYASPYEAKNNSEEYFSKIGTGHLQGMCVDDDLRYMYVSYTNGIGKIDMDTGEVAGYLTGFDSGLHIGCLAYYDGHIYGSFEAQATHKFYIIQVDESQFWGIMDTREKWLDAVRVILLWEPTVDARDLMGDEPVDSDGIAGRNQEEGHRYSNAGIDGVTFGTYPGEFGEEDADVYMFVSYGTYWFTNGTTRLSRRLDDEHIILQAYNTKDFLNDENNTQYLLELAYTDTTTPDQNGVSNARSIYYAEDSILHAEKALWCFVGNTQWGCQQIEFDRSTGDIWLATYGASDGSPVAGTNWHVVDGSKAPQNKEIQLGQNANANATWYGSLAGLSQADKEAMVTRAKERATRYGDNVKVANSTWDTWEYHPNGSDTSKHFSENGYPVADIPYMKCVCGNNCHGLNGKGDYIGYTAANGYDVDNMICCGKSQSMFYGLVSLGNGYWYWNNGGGHLRLYHMDGWSAETGAVGNYVEITASNVESYRTTDLGTISTGENRTALSKMLTRAKRAYPASEQGDFSNATWTALQTAITSAERVASNTSSDAAAITAATAALRKGLNGLRKTNELDTLKTEHTRMSEKLYGKTNIDNFKASVDTALAGLKLSGDDVDSQTKIDDTISSTRSLLTSLLPSLDGFEAKNAKSISELGSSENNIKDAGYELLSITVPSGKTVKVKTDGLTIRTLGEGEYLVPIVGVNTLIIEGTATGTVAAYKDLRTIAGIKVDGKELYGFNAATLSYTAKVSTKATSAPTVSVTEYSGCGATVAITQASEVEGTATIVVTRAEADPVTYTVKFQKDTSMDPVTSNPTPTEIYASDIDPLWCTTYPNRRGKDGENERFMRDQGWQFNGQTADMALTGANSSGTVVSYSKGFTLHGITNHDMPADSEEHTFSEAATVISKNGQKLYENWIKAYTDRFKAADSTYYFKGLSETAAKAAAEEYYSSVSFDVKDYTKFQATMSIAGDQYTGSSNSSLTVNIYKDGTLANSYKLHSKKAVASAVGIDLDIDLTGVSRLTIQVDPKNVDSIGNDTDWANGDIVTFGNAKFTKPATKEVSVKATELTPLWCTTYPNRRGQASNSAKNARFIVNQGWANPDSRGADNTADAAFMSGFDYGFTLHAITNYAMPTGSEEHIFSGVAADATGEALKQKDGQKLHDNWVKAYTDRFKDTSSTYYFKGLSETAAAAAAEEYYSSVSFDVTDYTKFSTTVASYYSDGNANATLRVYFDGVVQNAYTRKIVGGTRFDLTLDLTGVKRLTLQLDPKNDGTPGSDTDWANRDLVAFGNPAFTKEVPDDPVTTYPQDKVVYLSDSDVNPAHNAQLSVNGSNTIGTDDAKTGVHFMHKNSGNNSVYNKDGTEKTFTKWLCMEPLVAEQVGYIKGTSKNAEMGAGETAYRNQYFNGENGKNYIDYSSVTWDIDGKGYSRFRCSFGPRYGSGNCQRTDAIVNFYLDGVLAASYTVLGTNGGSGSNVTMQDVDLDIRGAKTFTIQIDPYGQGILKLDDLANQDILVFGDARFETYANTLEHTHSPSSDWTQGENGHWHACASCDAHLDYAAHTPGAAATESAAQECTVCHKVLAGKLNHAPTCTNAVPATCTTAGNIEYFYCSNCNSYFTDEACTNKLTNGQADTVLAPTNHAGKIHVSYCAPTYTSAGNIEYWYCPACGKYFSDAACLNEVSSIYLAKLPTPTNNAYLPGILGGIIAQLPFNDVPVNSWYYSSVKSAWENGLIDGVSATQFNPNANLTVAQAIKLAAALHQLYTGGSVTLTNGQPWYDTYTAYAVSNGVIEGAYKSYSAAEMNATVTRAEFVHILYGALGSYAQINNVADNKIPDVKTTDKYAAEIYAFYRAGILTGSDANGSFYAGNSIKRSEVATILNRMYDATARQTISLS